MDITNISTELREEIDKEITKGYIGGIVDGTALITVTVGKKSTYKLGYYLEPVIRITKGRPHSIQIIDEWATKNGLFMGVREQEGRYQVLMNRTRDIVRFLEELYPYVYDKMEVFEIMLEDILPALDRGDYLSDKEGFVSVIEDIERVRELTEGRKASKYTSDYFRKEWEL